MPELITVIVILGLLAAVAAPRFFDLSSFTQRGSHDQVLASLRYAQKEAIAQHGFVCVAFAANSVTLTTGSANTCGTPLASPSGGAYVVQASFSPVPGNFSFDCTGIPRASGQGTCTDANGVLTSDQSVQVQGAALITVVKETGFVY
jgi:MSHA pilin protein MshC